jgi:hypothetical protein
MNIYDYYRTQIIIPIEGVKVNLDEKISTYLGEVTEGWLNLISC